jgi:centromere/kinetochore protein ZW10
LLAQHSEKKMVARDEGVDIAQTGTVEVSDWDAGWESDEKEESEIPAGMNRASVEEERRASETYIPQLSPISSPADLDDDAADAWGWGDDDIADEPVAEPNPAEEKQPSKNEGTTPEMREVTLSEPYWTSSIPKPVFDTINVIYHDGAELTKPECVFSSFICPLTDL